MLAAVRVARGRTLGGQAMTLHEFLDKVPWAEMEVCSPLDSIRRRSGERECPIAAVTGNPKHTATPQTAARSLGLGASLANDIIDAADFATSARPRVAKLRAEMLRRMEVAHGAR